MMLIAMAGLPGTGKSSLAARLATELGAVVLNKDRVRAILFPTPVLDYSSAQDDLSMDAIYAAAHYILQTFPGQVVIIDGRTFLRSGQLPDLYALAAIPNITPLLIECVCADDVARARLENDLAQGAHPAGNRTFALYLGLKAAAKPIQIPHLTLDTGTIPLEKCVERCLEYLKNQQGWALSPRGQAHGR